MMIRFLFFHLISYLYLAEYFIKGSSIKEVGLLIYLSQDLMNNNVIGIKKRNIGNIDSFYA